ncbi:minor tail protein [Mycobacterium phage SchoolBus]|nr:minor tail protein [Mycobacterium phage SchoolBus]
MFGNRTGRSVLMVGNIVKRYPSNPITPHGAYFFLRNKKPNMTYRSYDDTMVFHLMGGMAVPDKVNSPESVQLKSLSGLIPPWQQIEQKGATQDGVTFVDALYDPLDCDMTVEVRGKTPERTAQLVRDWIAAWDAKKPGELSFFDTGGTGRWWAPVRWTRNPVDKLLGGNFTSQTFTWPFKSHDAFWRSYDNVDEFRFTYVDVEDDFTDLDNWILEYSGDGNGEMIAAPQRTGLLADIFGEGDWAATWDLGTTGEGRTVVAQRDGFATTTNRQIAYIRIGSIPAWSPWDEAAVDIWVRMDDGTPGENGIRLRLKAFSAELAYFVDGDKTVLRKVPIIPPLPGETWCVVAGVGDSDRTFRVLRGSQGLSEVFTVKENGTGSLLGEDYRGMGFGMESGTGAFVELPPATVRRFWGGDNATQTQSGMLRRVNVGDQPMWDRYTLHGPGTFYIAAGPGSTDMVKFGPLERGQVVQLRSDPRKRGVVDLTSVAPSPQQLKWWQEALKDFISFASGNNASPLEETILSKFGIKPPQGNLYSLLEGRFAKPIPPKPAAGPVKPYSVLVKVENGDADTRVVAAGTPLRRWPM